jgi:GtrA-like protein
VKHLRAILHNKRLLKYLVMAITIVCIELVSFQIIYLLTKNYYLGTVLSFTLAVVLNWIGGRVFVFGISHHHPAREFTMVLIASIVGLIIQTSVVYVSVEIVHLYPLIGKMLSICFSFFWNYWFRAAIVYKKPSSKTKQRLSGGALYLRPQFAHWALFIGFGLLAAFLFFLRFPNNFFEPNFYAEDGSIFLRNIEQHGFLQALFTPFNGYFIFGQYLLEGLGFVINFLFFHGQFVDLAKSFAVASYLLLGFACALPLLLFRHYFRPVALGLIFILTVFIPMVGSDYAIIGTIGNLKFVFVYIAFLLLVYRHLIPPTSSWRRFIAIDMALALCAYTNVVVYFLLPFALVRYWPLFRRLKFKQLVLEERSFQSLVGLGVVLLPQVIMIKLLGIPALHGYLDTPYRREATVNLFIYRSYLYPFASHFIKYLNDIWVIFGFILATIGLWFGLKRYRAAYVFGMVTIFLTTLLFTVNRPGVSDFFTQYLSSGPDQFFYTQNMIFCFLVALAVAAGLYRLHDVRARLAAYSGIAVLVIAFYIPASGTYGNNDFMQRTVKNIYVTAQAACQGPGSQPDLQLYPVVSDAFHVKYEPRAAICTSAVSSYVPDTEYLSITPGAHGIIEDVARARMTQTISADYDGLSGVSIQFLTYKQPINDRYMLYVLSADCRTELRVAPISPYAIHDTQYTRINFAPIKHSKNEQYCLMLSLQGTETSPLALALSEDNQYVTGKLTVNTTPRNDDLVLRLHYTK